MDLRPESFRHWLRIVLLTSCGRFMRHYYPSTTAAAHTVPAIAAT